MTVAFMIRRRSACVNQWEVREGGGKTGFAALRTSALSPAVPPAELCRSNRREIVNRHIDNARSHSKIVQFMELNAST